MKKIGAGVSEEKSFKCVNGRRTTTDGRIDDDDRRTASDHNIAHPEPSAKVCL